MQSRKTSAYVDQDKEVSTYNLLDRNIQLSWYTRDIRDLKKKWKIEFNLPLQLATGE